MQLDPGTPAPVEPQQKLLHTHSPPQSCCGARKPGASLGGPLEGHQLPWRTGRASKAAREGGEGAGEEGALPGLPSPMPCLARQWAGMSDRDTPRGLAPGGHVGHQPAGADQLQPASPGRPAPGRLNSCSNLPSCAAGRKDTAEGCWGHPGTPELAGITRFAGQPRAPR